MQSLKAWPLNYFGWQQPGHNPYGNDKWLVRFGLGGVCWKMYILGIILLGLPKFNLKKRAGGIFSGENLKNAGSNGWELWLVGFDL